MVFYARDSVVTLVRGWGMKYAETQEVSYGKIMFMYLCVRIGPTTMRKCIQNSLFQTVIENRTGPSGHVF